MSFRKPLADKKQEPLAGKKPLDKAGLCPLCGQPNNCICATAESRARDHLYPAEDKCWCFKQQKKPNTDVFTLALKNSPKQCICQICWEKLT